jgi:hypothetical protein
MKKSTLGLSASILVAVVAACAHLALRPSADNWVPKGAPADVRAPVAREACTDREPLRQAFFGDLHVHTAYSFDARSRDMLSTPNDAYRFARGETIGLGPFDEDGRGTRKARLARPLDFAAVTDHAEWIGEVTLCTDPDSAVHRSDSCRAYRGEIPAVAPFPGMGPPRRMYGILGVTGRKKEICGADAKLCRAGLLSAWQDIQRAAERWYDRSSSCSFTTFHGWEHSYSPGQSKVHRNVIFRNEIVPELPISSLEEPDAIGLWDELDNVCGGTGTACEAVTIPHNPNVSNGRLFRIGYRRERIEEQRRQASMRARMEPVVEMMQVKGESECRNGMYGVVGAEDELCDFEKVRGLGNASFPDCKEGIGTGALAGRGCESRLDFVRYALIEGLREEQRVGVNPYQFGFIGSTDSHNATPGDVEEYSYQGCCANLDARSEVRLSPEPLFAGRSNAARNPGGLMGVWAEENTRDALFDGIQRRETFATSGPRLSPRFFAGWDLPEDLCTRGDLVEQGYQQGVPMGGVLTSNGDPAQSPVFVASVTRDPGAAGHPGGLLDRLQIVKVWYGEDGGFHQEVHEIAGRVAQDPEAARASVDLATCQPRGSGHDALCGRWQDPSYDASRTAVYYVRAVENPSCRWSWRECLRLSEAERPSTCEDPAIPKLIQERVWTSPIWVEPSASSRDA